MKTSVTLLAVLAIFGTTASAQELEPEFTIFHVPSPGDLQTASVGTTIHEYSRTYSFNATVTDVDMRGGQWLIPLTVEAGTPLFPVSTRTEHKACVPDGPCGLDDDGDGTFDRMSADQVKSALKLKVPVPYRKVRITVDSPENLRKIVIYTGATSDTLRLSYREFINDLARPAFTEELVIPIGATYPQDVAVKNVKLRVHAIDGLGLRYEILP
ncbi:hypothetical protein ACFCW2_13675 [Qipengyuania sp. DSG2-2]|uniref:hypothetical protein n=1 Tax=Qipengyuania sp. DGS2-2 TaxID=3349631 RepID=UPI0036D36B6B